MVVLEVVQSGQRTAAELVIVTAGINVTIDEDVVWLSLLVVAAFHEEESVPCPGRDG